MTPQDPYFPPPMHNIPTVWRSNSLLVMTKQAQLPDRCVKCNAPTQHRLKRSLRWHHPAIYLLIACGLLFYVILALVLSKSATIHVGLCETHSAARKRNILITCLLMLTSFVSFYFGASVDEPMLFLVGAALLLASAIYGVVTRVVAPQKIDHQYVWLNGVNSEYLKQFPEWQRAR